MPSNSKFGLFFGGTLFLLGCYGLFHWPREWAIAALVAAGLFVLLALTAPALLAPLNRAWFALGLLMGRIVSPIVLGAIFFLVLTPTAIVSRAVGRDPLRLKKQAGASCWIDRAPPGPPPESFRDPF